MTSLHKQDRGFTILELLVVTLVILGLGFLMFNSMADVRARDRDTERRSDINLLHLQLEFYYDLNEVSSYPTAAQLQDENWVKEHMKGLSESPEAFVDPFNLKLNAEGGDYTYEPKDCTETGCAGYTLSADQEKSQPDPYVKTNVSQ